MKRVLNIILCISLLLFLSAVIKINNNIKVYKIEKVLAIEKNVYSNETNFNEEYERLKIEQAKQKSIKKATVQKTVQKRNNNNKQKVSNVKYGTYGRLYVSTYNVALYDFNVHTNSNSTLQTIVNGKDSAAYYTTKDRLVIADHNYQGFNILVNLKIGTTSYIKFKDGSTIKYKLVKKAKGYNKKTDLVDTNGNSFFGMESDIIMYTCYKDGIMVTLWNLA